MRSAATPFTVLRRCALFFVFPLFSIQTTLAAPLDIGREIVVVHRTTARAEHAAALSSVAAFSAASGLHVSRVSPDQRYMVVGKNSEATQPLSVAQAKKWCADFMSRNDGFLCDANRKYSLTRTPNDSSYGNLWGLRKIKAPRAWDYSTGSADVIVAVVDTGVDYTHPDLVNNIAINFGENADDDIDDDDNGYTDDVFGYDFVDGDNDPYDENEHGTHVSGTIGAQGNNGAGITGVNWSVGVLPVRVLDAQGSGYLSDVAAGVDYAVSRGASVINLSLGGPGSSILEHAIRDALYANVLVIAAAGNENNNNDRAPSYPASYTLSNIIAVAATDQHDRRASFSNYGARSVDLSAPGVSILSTVPGGDYSFFSGTSMATPHVAGVAALLKSLDPSLGASDIKRLILNNVDKITAMKKKCVTNGRLNAAKAVDALLRAQRRNQ